MSNHCPRYNRLLQDWREAISRLRVVYEEFQESGDLELENIFEEAKKEVQEKEEIYRGFAYEEVSELPGIKKRRIISELEKFILDENASWEVIKLFSRIPGEKFNLTNIRQEHKDKIIHWGSSILDKSDTVSYKKLRTVAGFLNLYKARNLSIENAQKIGGWLNVQEVRDFTADNLEEINGSLFAQNAKIFHTKSLTRVRTIHLTRANFADENDQIDFEKLEREGRLVLPEETREKIHWV